MSDVGARSQFSLMSQQTDKVHSVDPRCLKTTIFTSLLFIDEF